MENSEKNIDLLFQKKFEDFQPNPPESVWEKIKANLPKNPMGGLSGTSFIKTFVVILILAVPAYFIIDRLGTKNITKDNVKSINDSKFTTNNTQNLIEKDISIQETFSLNIETEEKSIPPVKKENTIESNIKKEIPIIQITENNIVTTNTSKVEKQNSLIEENELLLAYLPQENEIITSKNKEDNTFEKQINIESKAEVAVYNPVREKKGYFTFGAFFNPEMVFYPSDDIPNKTNLNLDLSISYNFSKLFFQSGLGIGLAEDDGNYNIDFERYEFLGSYEDVYNVTFDSTEQGVIPTFHTHTVDVYDSIRHIQISQTQNSYTYLQIPVFVGYKINSNKFSYSLKGGPSLSLLVFEKIPEAILPSGNISVININETNPGRIKTYWYFMLSAGIEYKLNNKISVAFEPTFRYYMKSAYERNYFTTKHPFSIGFRTGVLIRL
ncbi:MAG: hypothetical protein K8R41_08860 [Bacteroidales bacterium]|nr:hypothetical protein [Bacteroidales bacterium]